MNLETRRFILGLIMFFLFATSFAFAYKETFTDGYTINLIYSMVVSVLFAGVGFFLILKNTGFY